MTPESNAKVGKLSMVLNAIEWIGNKLPDPAILFLIGLFIVLGLSHVAAPRMPDGFAVRWVPDKAAGGVDQHVSVVGRVVRDDSGQEVGFERARYEVVRGEDGEGSLAAHLVLVDSGEVARDAAGVPIDMAGRGWAVFEKRPRPVTDPETGVERLELVSTGSVLFARSLITSDGWYWLLSSMTNNFLGFAPLGVVLLGMLGIGPMEKVGLISALLRAGLARVSGAMLTPAMVFLGIMSSIGSDAGYVVLPPLAALAYAACGRSPLAGIAAVFAGVSAGFNANLLITSLEPMISNMSQQAAQTIDPDRIVVPTSSWYFMAVSTILLTFAGWATTAVFVEKRLARKPVDEGGADPAMAMVSSGGADGGDLRLGAVMLGVALLLGGVRFLGMFQHIDAIMRVPAWVFWSPAGGLGSIGALHVIIQAGRGMVKPEEHRALLWSSVAFGLGMGLTLLMVYWEGSPLHGMDGNVARWVSVIVPLMFVLTIVPAMVYGVIVGVIRSSKDATQTMIDSMAAMAPIIVLAFFAGQFVAAFDESGLGRMLAFTGGEWLFSRQFSAGGLIVAFIFVTIVFDLFMGSMSAKYALFAPIFVPMFMLIGIRPELTQTAYRIGDSTANIITPLNSYLIIILMYVQKYAPKAGIGTLIAMMLPYTVVFTIVWVALILVWERIGIPLGPGDLGQAFSPQYLEAQAAP